VPHIWVALVDEEGPLHQPLRWQPPFVRRFQSPKLRMKRDSVGEVRTMMWRGPRDLTLAPPRDRASHVQPFTVDAGDTINIRWDIGMDWHNAPGLPVSLQYAVEEAIERWADGGA
jgi:hypothetical protein